MNVRSVKTFWNNHGITVIVAGLCVWGFILRIRPLIVGPHLWLDEYWQLMIMHGSWREMIILLQRHEHTAFLSLDYLVIYPFFKLFGFNKIGLALPHLALTLLGFLYLYRISRMYLRTALGYAVVFGIFCFNASLVSHATEVRVYAALPTLALMVFYYSQKLAGEAYRLRGAERFWLGVFFVTALWFHVYGITMVACMMFYVFLEKQIYRDKERFLFLIKFFSVILAVAMPLWLYSVLGPNLNVWEGSRHTFEYIANPAVNFVGFSKSVLGNLVGYKRLYILLPGMFVPFIFSYPQRFRHIGFFLVLVIIPLQLLLQGVLSHSYWFLQRQFVWVVPFFALYLGICWEAGLSWGKKTFSWISAGIFQKDIQRI